MKKDLVPLIFIILLISFASASPIDEFFQANVTSLNITINQTETLANLYLNTSDTTFDTIEVEFEEGSFIEFPISSFLEGINGQIEIQEGSDTPQFNFLTIEQGSITQLLLDLAFQFLNISFRSDDINQNVSVLNEFLIENPSPIPSDRHLVLTKQGNDFLIWNNKGYGDIPEDQLNEIRDIINKTMFSVNIENLVTQFLPLIDQNVSLLENLDLDYNVSLINLDSVSLVDGEYNIIVQVEKNNQTFNKTILLTLEGIENAEIVQVNETYIPTQPEILEVISKIEGLENNTIIEIHVFDDITSILEVSVPIVKKAFKFLNITVSNQTSAELTFTLDLSEVTNPELVSLYIWEGSWVKLNTNLVSSGGQYEFIADIPHFSLFMIAEENEPDPPIIEEDDSGEGDRDRKKRRNKQPIIPTVPDYEVAPDGSRPEPAPIDLTPDKKERDSNFGVFILFAFIILIIVLIAVGVDKLLDKPIKKRK